MGIRQAVGGHPGGHVYQQTGPMAARMVLGAQLRRMREDRDITREEAGEAIQASHTKIGRLELGQTSVKENDMTVLLTRYGAVDEAERATLLALARQANAPRWWQPYSDVVPNWFETYLGLEQAARVIRNYEAQFIPGLLQTEGYARAITGFSRRRLAIPQIERCVELRMRRQRILRGARPPHLWAVIDEGALRRPFGGVPTMRAQLDHLLDISELGNVTIQVMPFSAGGHAAAGGPIAILRLPEHHLPDVVYLEQLVSARYPDRPGEIQYYWDLMNRLATEAEQATAARAVLHRIRKEI
ncbi:helix-turn-helix domain-containing protein [Allosalinactinospora lopnorensis]|uniref:helix-turn-helix domain-containing protein n=1 Tax=Allosalinactinospora lopnorensis TaxID=1352348 RepID=UPI000623D139|nr:helix-turn-helix transcriptional regulator [Allosalinactinospora lopnorensis]